MAMVYIFGISKSCKPDIWKTFCGRRWARLKKYQKPKDWCGSNFFIVKDFWTSVSGSLGDYILRMGRNGSFAIEISIQQSYWPKQISVLLPIILPWKKGSWIPDPKTHKWSLQFLVNREANGSPAISISTKLARMFLEPGCQFSHLSTLTESEGIQDQIHAALLQATDPNTPQWVPS